MAESRGRWRWLAVPACALAVWAVAHTDHTPQHPVAPHTPAPTASSSAPPGAGNHGTPEPSSSYDPADYGPQVRKYAAKAGIEPQLLMAILYCEAYKPHDPDLERAWQRYKPDAAFGIANMHRAAFDEARRGRDFAGRRWDELPDDRGLAVEAAAWHLHDLARQLPARWPASYSRQDLLALGYNTGVGNMLAFARGVTPGGQARSYLDRLHENWGGAGRAVAR
ncbi:lytic transglycosylase domain-containing protein [Streptomyces pinistramenti]|uniref:lytic transglycosylase domain-containing protein n=1 Tax=Streptomyces pinistramenti TaxID=2884812 RepID=UPI001D086A1C|nr:lytic transglycosylase domain-containing protein [Streptomyces pinistramenti]MCB5908823.1 lytic transglycosylase domain-containing protein [Streptomyces pinistramenti]